MACCEICGVQSERCRAFRRSKYQERLGIICDSVSSSVESIEIYKFSATQRIFSHHLLRNGPRTYLTYMPCLGPQMLQEMHTFLCYGGQDIWYVYNSMCLNMPSHFQKLARDCTLYFSIFRLERVLTMVYNTQNYWVYGFFPSSSILENRKHDVSESGSVSVLTRGVEDTYSVGLLRKS
jgi:hypothetical protein